MPIENLIYTYFRDLPMGMGIVALLISFSFDSQSTISENSSEREENRTTLVSSLQNIEDFFSEYMSKCYGDDASLI